MSDAGAHPGPGRREVDVEDAEKAIAQLPEERRDELIQVLVSQETHSGPVPSPRSMAGYELVSPGLAQGLFDMAARQQAHDHRMQLAIFESETSYRKLTLFAAAAVLLTVIVGAVALGIYGQTGAAVALASLSGLAVLAGVVLRGRDLALHQSRDTYREGSDDRDGANETGGG